MKYIKCKKYILLIIIILTTGIIIMICNKNSSLTIKSSLKQNQNIVPVLYYEENCGSSDYNTHTFLVSNKNIVNLEKHYRSFSRTYPISALNENALLEYGQLMVYYKTNNGEVFLFDKFTAEQSATEFCIIKNDNTVTIPYKEQEFFFDFLCFDNKYYLFTLVNTNSEFGDTDIIRATRISDALEIEKVFDIEYGKLGIPSYAFIGNSIAVVENTLLANVRNGQDYYLLKYDFITETETLIQVEYGLFGVVASDKNFITIGYTNSGKIVFETFDSFGKTIAKNIKPLPFDLLYSPEIFSFGNIFYVYDSEIYFSFKLNNKCYLISFDIDCNEWSNFWIIDKKDLIFLPVNIKFMCKEKEVYFDLFPSWDSAT